MSPDSTAEAVDPTYSSLFRVGGVAALLVALLTVMEVVVFTFYPQPSTVRGWFELFLGSPILGLIDFWGLEMPMYAMFILVFLAVYAVLKHVDQGSMVIALSLALLGIGIFFATNLRTHRTFLCYNDRDCLCITIPPR